MTDEWLEAERREFEAWARPSWFVDRRHNLKPDEYQDAGTQCAWLGWLARARKVPAALQQAPAQEPVGVIASDPGHWKGAFYITQNGVKGGWHPPEQGTTAMLFKPLPVGTQLYTAPLPAAPDTVQVPLTWEQAVRSTITDPETRDRILSVPRDATPEEARAILTAAPKSTP